MNFLCHMVVLISRAKFNRNLLKIVQYEICRHLGTTTYFNIITECKQNGKDETACRLLPRNPCFQKRQSGLCRPMYRGQYFQKDFHGLLIYVLENLRDNPDDIREHIYPDILDPSHRNTSVSQSNNYMFYTEPGVT